MYRKILVTGGSGLLGQGLRAVSQEFPDREFVFANSKQCDLTKLDDTLRYFGEHNPDAVIHFAAVAGGIQLSMDHPASLLRDNIYINMNVLEAGRVHQVGKTIMTLSSGIYPPDAPNPMSEDYLHDGSPDDSNYGYSFAKRLVDPSIRAYRTEYGMNVIGLIPNGIVGEHGNYSPGASIMVAALIRRFYENRDNQEQIVIWGDGSPLREYTDSRDIARAFMWCLDGYDDAQVLNVGSTEEHSVKDIAYMIAETLGVDSGRIEFDTSKPPGTLRKSTDNSRFVSLSGFQYTPFRTALERTIRWFAETCDKPGEVRL